MRIGVVILPEHRWPDGADLWRRAEDLGFDHAWTYDHIGWRSLRDSTWFSAVPTLAAAAVATSTIRLGTLVASPNFRHPVPFARELITLDDLSAGRITLGIGAGSSVGDATVLGNDAWPPLERAARFDEFVRLLDRLLTNPLTSHVGEHYSASDAAMVPGCVQAPRLPFAVAAMGPRGMRLAAEHGDTWVTVGDRTGTPLDLGQSVALVGAQQARLDAACAAVGRAPATISRLALTGHQLASGTESADEFAHAAERYEAAGITDLVVHWPRESGVHAGDVGAFEAAVRAVVGTR